MPAPARTSLRLRLSVLLAVLALAAACVGLRVVFPLEYRDEILRCSQAYSLDPVLVASVIRHESRYRSDVESVAGAIGLMQIMPETGAWIAEKLGRLDFTSEQLTNVDLNIEFGCWYLRHLFDRFPDQDVVLMAYNAGPTNANRWEGRLEEAFPETQRYIKRVNASLPVYRFYFANPWFHELIPSLHF